MGRSWGDEVDRQTEVGLGRAGCAMQRALDSRLERLGWGGENSEQQRARWVIPGAK